MEQSRAIGVGDAQSVAATRSGKGESTSAALDSNRGEFEVRPVTTESQSSGTLRLCS